MSSWILLWKIVFFAGISSFIVMFVFVVCKGFFEIIDLLKNKKQ